MKWISGNQYLLKKISHKNTTFSGNSFMVP
jgi:hypothetical protein